MPFKNPEPEKKPRPYELTIRVVPFDASYVEAYIWDHHSDTEMMKHWPIGSLQLGLEADVANAIRKLTHAVTAHVKEQNKI